MITGRGVSRAQKAYHRNCTCGLDTYARSLNEQRSSPKTRPRAEPARRHDDRSGVDDRLGNLYRFRRIVAVGGSPGWLLAAWALAGVLTITGALCCAELAAMWPRAGGQYVFLREAYGPSIGFLFGWGLFLIIQTGTIAAVAVAFANFTGVLTDWISADRISSRPRADKAVHDQSTRSTAMR